MEESMRKRLEATRSRYEALEEELGREDAADDLASFTKKTKEQSDLREAYEAYLQYLKAEQDVADSFELEADPEMAE